MLRAHKIRLDPNDKQKTYLMRALGTGRFAHNRALGNWLDENSDMPEVEVMRSALAADYNPNKNLSRDKTRRLRNAAVAKAENALRGALRKSEFSIEETKLRCLEELDEHKPTEFPWMYESPDSVPKHAIGGNLMNAFKGFLSQAKGFPRFKKKGKNENFTLDVADIENLHDIQCGSNYLGLPNLKMPIRMAESLRFKGKVCGIIISKKAGRWYAAFQVKVDDNAIHNSYKYPDNKNHVVGVDLGIKVFATFSDKQKRVGSHADKVYKKHLRRQERALARKVGRKWGVSKSKNYLQHQEKVAKIHRKIAHRRLDYIHKVTTELAANYSVIGIESLGVLDMIEDWRTRHIASACFYEFRRQLKYKCDATGTILVEAPKSFPSTQLCSECGFKNTALKGQEALTIRKWICPNCGVEHDRDVNAAKNLENYAIEYVNKSRK